jgi:glycosyltransferase involved in cell wall biosynthesis
MPAVSVVVPSYNHARFLERRMLSILGQTYQDFDVLVLDDASTDDTASVLERFASHPAVRIEMARSNSGSPFRQWNAGVGRTTSPLVWIAESDDEADPRLLQTLVSRLDRHPSCGLAFAQSMGIDAEGRARGTVATCTDTVDTEHWRSDYVNDGRDEVAHYLAIANTIPSASAVVFRRDVYERAGRAPESMRIAGDWMTWLEMLLVSDVAFVAEPLNRHRSHGSTVRASLVDGARWHEETLAVWRVARARIALPATTRTKIVDVLREVLVRLARRPVAHRRVIAELFAFGRELDPGLPASLVRMLGARVLNGLRIAARDLMAGGRRP